MCCYIPRTLPEWLMISLVLTGCASQVPTMIRKAPPDNPSLEAVHANPEDFLTRQVRWGGKLIETENHKDTTWLTVLGANLSKDGEPWPDEDNAGRFIAIVPAFLDPKVYAADRKVTFTGTLLRTETRLVGDFPYRYPVVQAQSWYLWPRESEMAPYGYPYPGWYDPWYGPWSSPWYPYGYRYWR